MNLVRKLAVTLTGLAMMLATIPALAAGAWYGGEIKRIYVNSNGFVMTVHSSALNDCKHKYVYFKVSQIGDKRVDRAYSLALLARSLGEPVTFVIDKDVNGTGGFCDSNGSIDMGPKS